MCRRLIRNYRFCKFRTLLDEYCPVVSEPLKPSSSSATLKSSLPQRVQRNASGGFPSRAQSKSKSKSKSKSSKSELATPQSTAYLFYLQQFTPYQNVSRFVKVICAKIIPFAFFGSKYNFYQLHKSIRLIFAFADSAMQKSTSSSVQDSLSVCECRTSFKASNCAI